MKDDPIKKLHTFNRSMRRGIVKKIKKMKLRGVRSNSKGGWNIKTIMSDSEFEIFRQKGQGLYAWVTESQYKIMKGDFFNLLSYIKVGQYGAKNNNKTPDETINDEFKVNESIVILWAYRFTDEDIQTITDKYKDTDLWKIGPAYVVEQIIKNTITSEPVQKDGSGVETYFTSIPIIINEVEKELNKEELLIPFISSKDKEDAIIKMIMNPTKYFGLFAVMRHGKSWDYLEYIKRKYAAVDIFENHVIFCHDTKTYDGWKRKVNNSYKDCINLIELKDNKDYDFSKTPMRNTIILISPQLISAYSDNNGITNFEDKLKSLKESYDIQAENIFVDEAHNYFTPQWEKYYESILKGGQIILASGTAANIILKHQDKFDETNTFIWGIKELKAKLLEELNILLMLEVKLIQLKNTDGSDFNIANLQSEDDGVLSNQYHFEEFVGKMLNPNSKFSPILSRDRKHHLALFDTIKAAKEFKRIIENSKYSDEIVPILVAGSNGRDANSEKDVNKLILKAESQGKRTVTLTCGSMIQGVSERNWKSIINLSSKSTYTIYFQLFGRGFEFHNELDNYTGGETKEERVIMWDYNPNRIYEVGAEFVDSMAKTNGSDQTKALKYFFDIIDITEYVDERRTFSDAKSYEEIESKINEIVNKNIIRRGLTINTCLNRRFDIGQLPSEWIEWAIKQKWSSVGKSGDKVRKQKLDIWEQNLLKQKTDHSKSQKDKTQRHNQKEILDLQEQVKRSFEKTLSKLDIVWAVYKSQGKVDYHIDELFNYYNEDEFLTGLGLPNKEVSKVFVETVKQFGLTDKINGKLKDSRIETIENFLNMDNETFLKTCDNTIDKWFNYDGDNTQLSVRDSYNILKTELKKTKAKVGQKFVVKNAKSGSINLALTYLLKENSKKIFGRELTNKEIIESVSYEDKNTFFESLINTMGFSKTTHTKKDFIIINPPYNKHEEIFNKSFDMLNDGGVLICIHPSTHFLNRKPTSKTSKIQRQLDIVTNYKSRLTLVDGNKIFDAGFFVPLSITRVEKVLDEKIEVVYSHIDSSNKEVKTYDKLDDIFIHGNDIVLKIRDQIFSKMKSSIEDNVYRKGKSSEYYLTINKMVGNIPRNEGKMNPDFYCLVNKKYENSVDDLISNIAKEKWEQKGGSQFNQIALNSYDECVNTHHNLMTKFSRFALSIYKIASYMDCGELLSVPFLDPSKKYSDLELYDYFELNQEEIEFINTYIQNWYERDFN
jgi:hypothetical protein